MLQSIFIKKFDNLIGHQLRSFRDFRLKWNHISRFSFRLIIFCFSGALASDAESLPENLLLGLGEPRFADREQAQSKLLDWGRSQPVISMPELLKHSRTAADPEVRARCNEVLFELIKDQYLTEGTGFIGIAMGNSAVQVAVPGDAKPRYGIHVSSVNEGGPGQKAGLKPNDIIVGLDREVWHKPILIETFTRKITSIKPNQKVKLQILRGNLLEIEVQLTRRPIALMGIPNLGHQLNLEKQQKAEVEAHFQQWLAKQKTK